MQYIDNPFIVSLALGAEVRGPVYRSIAKDSYGNEIVAPVFIIKKGWKRKMEEKRLADQTCMDKISEILGAIMEINSLEERNVKVSGSLPTAFFSFSGHVALVSVSINVSGWREYANSLHMDAKVQSLAELDEMLKALKALKSALEDKNGNF